jgi:hypothetical protein
MDGRPLGKWQVCMGTWAVVERHAGGRVVKSRRCQHFLPPYSCSQHVKAGSILQDPAGSMAADQIEYINSEADRKTLRRA